MLSMAQAETVTSGKFIENYNSTIFRYSNGGFYPGKTIAEFS